MPRAEGEPPAAPASPSLSGVSEIFSGQLTAVANVVLAVFAIITGVLAALAFLKQSREVRAIERQVSDEQEVTAQQAQLLPVQTGQLEVLRDQLADQRKASAAQAEVLELQAAELRESLEEPKREAEARRSSQASLIAAWFASVPDHLRHSSVWGAAIRNASDLPVFDVHTFFHQVNEPTPGLGWQSVRCCSGDTIRVLAPQAERQVPIPVMVSSQMEECNDRVYVLSIWFTDVGGKRWERDPPGALNPLS